MISMAARFAFSKRVRSKSANLEFSFIDLTDPAALEEQRRVKTPMTWVETPSNPLLKLIDLEAVARFSHETIW